MTPERWQQVARVYQSALEHEPSSRAAFLADTCRDDSALRREVESLLAREHAPIVIDQPVDIAAAAVLTDAHRLAPGSFVGPYRVTALLGEGGMGQVYRAHDTKLQRDVALKILPDAFVHDADRIARFTREAQVLASLNHPNIGAIYGFEDSGDVHALVLELIEGATLADRIERAPLPVDDALAIARQIAEALEAAHEHGIVHRDLKPANIKVREDGTVKVLDFGLAKPAGPPEGGHYDGRSVRLQPDLTQSPTIMSPAVTGMGVILGTAAYMSPEQAKGKPADKRSDIWAFGCVLYEMLTGKRAFEGEDVSDTLAAVLRGEPHWNALPRDVSPAISVLAKRCLEKDRRRRIADVSTVLFVLSEPGNLVAKSGVSQGSRLSSRQAVAIAATCLLAAVAAWFARGRWDNNDTLIAARATRVTTTLAPNASLVSEASDRGSVFALSPDGSTVAFVAEREGRMAQLFVRRLDQLDATPLAGTEGAYSPFFSPDGHSVAFYADSQVGQPTGAQPRHFLKRIPVEGGSVATICPVVQGRGGSWIHNGTIALLVDNAPGKVLFRVSSTGGEPQPLTTLAPGELAQRWPQLLPDGRALIYVSSRSAGDYDNAEIVVTALPMGDRKVLAKGLMPQYVDGHLLFVRKGTLFAAPFDEERLELRAEPVPIVDGIEVNEYVGTAQFAASSNGTLVYLPGGEYVSPIQWSDRQGRLAPLRAAADDWGTVAFSPDGERLAMDMLRGAGRDIVVYDWKRDLVTPVTSDEADDRKPVWSPDGQRIVFTSKRGGSEISYLYWRRADGTGPIERLTRGTWPEYPSSWHHSGKYLAYTVLNPQTTQDIMILPIDGDEGSGWKPGEPRVFLNTPGNDGEPAFSPDGRWIAYTSERATMYVQPFPGPGPRVPVATNGAYPVWSRARNELFYAVFRTGQLMMVPFTVNGTFRPEKPRPWSDIRYDLGRTTSRQRHFDLHADGNRFAVVTEAASTAKDQEVVIVFNALEALRRKGSTTP